MITRLPRWVEFGGFWLACIAGGANAIGLLGFRHQAISHLTGVSSLLGVAIAELDLVDTAHLLGIMSSFVLGAALAGAMVGGATLRLGRRYGVALMLESLLFLGAMVVLLSDSIAGHYLASAACGLQNGMVSTYSGAIVRTTHVSGLFTDLGTMFGAWFRGARFQRTPGRSLCAANRRLHSRRQRRRFAIRENSIFCHAVSGIWGRDIGCYLLDVLVSRA